MIKQRRIYYLSYLYSPQPERAGAALFWRMHWGAPDRPLTPQDAYSVLWGTEEDARQRAIANGEALRGYSCCRSPEALYAYFADRGTLRDCEGAGLVAVFWGREVGIGPDGEPLAVPVEGAPIRFLSPAAVAALVERRWESGVLERRYATRRAAAERAHEAAEAAARARAQDVGLAMQELAAAFAHLARTEVGIYLRTSDWVGLRNAQRAFMQALRSPALAGILSASAIDEVEAALAAALAPHIPPMYRR